jgi:hypothetical protein
MRRSFRGVLSTIVTVALLSAGLVLVNGQPAYARHCGSTGTSGSVWTQSWVSGSNPCHRVQSRITRYYGGIPRYYYGPVATFSGVSNQLGTDIGNHYRDLNRAVSAGGTWSGWISV